MHLANGLVDMYREISLKRVLQRGYPESTKCFQIINLATQIREST